MFFLLSIRMHTRGALVTGVQMSALTISSSTSISESCVSSSNSASARTKAGSVLMPCSLWSPMRFYPVVMAPRFDRRRRPDPGSDGALLSETRGGVQRQHIAVGAMARNMFRRGDRKSVVEGKGVPGRVDPGGRRSIKKKKQKK